MLSNYEIKYTIVSLENSYYFIPNYALHRPAVKSFINGYFHEPQTHKFINYFCSKYIGSIIHAGAFFGDMLPNFSKYVNGSVFAFEPVLENYILSKLCIEKNNIVNVILINSALSDNISNLKINVTQNNGLHAGGASSISNSGQICSAVTIDCLDIKDLILIHLDIEGHELRALNGAINTICKRRPVIAIEDNTDNCTNFLITQNYRLTCQIPGLHIWSPKENLEVDKSITSFIYHI
jgi:FkbM family methyltransferase